MEIFQQENIIFISAIAIVLSLGLIELVSLLIGASIHHCFNTDHCISHIVSHNNSFDMLSWLNKGKLLSFIWIILFLSIFGLIGLTIQNISFNLIGHISSGLLVSIPTAILALISMSIVSSLASKIMIKDETTAISPEMFIGEIATIVIGTTKKGFQTEAKFTDRFGQTHYFQVEPLSNDVTISKGENALIVGMFKDKARVFAIVKDFNDELVKSIKEKELYDLNNL